MKKFGLALLGIIAGITILGMLGPLGGLLFSAAIAYAGVHFYIKSDTTFAKVVWALVAIAAALSTIANFPGLLGLAAIALLVYVYKKGDWGNKKAPAKKAPKASNDPFQNFEKEWHNLTK